MTTVELQISGHVARVIFRDPKGVHLLPSAVRFQFADVLGRIEQQTDCRVVVFESSGRTFIAGADINELKSLDGETAEQFSREGQQLMSRVAALTPLTIAAIHAACTGGGCELALACDVRMAAASARIGLPEVSLGIVPGWGGTVRAVRLFGGAVARRIILTGELFSGEQALALGIVDSVTADEEFREAVDRRIAQFLSRGPLACQAAKRLISALSGELTDEDFALEAVAFGDCYAAGEPSEGTAAFLEKRAPDWK